VKEKVCPLRLAGLTPLASALSQQSGKDDYVCLEADCAWWNEEFGMCCLAALTRTFTHPVVAREMRDSLR